MVRRWWRGWCRPEDAELYQRLLLGEIVPSIVERRFDGLSSIEVLRRRDPSISGDVEFATLMTFQTWSHVEGFAGDEPSASVVPDAARRLLARYDGRSAHFDRLALFEGSVGQAGR